MKDTLSDIVKIVSVVIGALTLLGGTYVLCRVEIARNDERIASLTKIEEEKWCTVRRDLDRIEKKIDQLSAAVDQLRTRDHAAIGY